MSFPSLSLVWSLTTSAEQPMEAGALGKPFGEGGRGWWPAPSWPLHEGELKPRLCDNMSCAWGAAPMDLHPKGGCGHKGPSSTPLPVLAQPLLSSAISSWLSRREQHSSLQQEKTTSINFKPALTHLLLSCSLTRADREKPWD